VKLDADEVLFIAGDAGDGCYRVEDGLLKVTMVSRAGGERILAFLGQGAIVGELSMLDGLPRSASVVAVRAATLSFLSRAAFEDFARKHPEVYKSLVTLIAARLRETDGAIAAGSFLPLRGRVAATLLELAQEFGQDVGSGRIVIRQKIGQATSRPWPGSRARMSAASSMTGNGASWSAGCPAIIAWKTRQSCKTKPNCNKIGRALLKPLS
jgi:CRP/FNR family cyclic AMP-dependent transcriptional regulator